MAVKLTPEELPAFQFYVDCFDANQDGKINASELGEMMKTLHSTRGRSNNMSEEQITALLAEADADGNGTLDFSEFMVAYGIVLKRRLQNKDDEKAFEDAFFFFDKDGNSSMSADELGQLMKVLGEPMTAEEVAAMIKEADTNKDDFFNMHEFGIMMKKKYWK